MNFSQQYDLGQCVFEGNTCTLDLRIFNSWDFNLENLINELTSREIRKLKCHSLDAASSGLNFYQFLMMPEMKGKKDKILADLAKIINETRIIELDNNNEFEISNDLDDLLKKNAKTNELELPSSNKNVPEEDNALKVEAETGRAAADDSEPKPQNKGLFRRIFG